MLRYASVVALTLCTTIMPLAGGTPAAASIQHTTISSGISGRAAANVPITNFMPPVRATGDPTPLPTLGQPKAQKAPDVQVTLNTLRRDPTGFVTLVWTVRYTGSDRLLLNHYFGDRSAARSSTFESGPTLVDEAAQLRYNSIQIVPSQNCACTNSSAAPGTINSGEWNIMYNTFKVPPNVSKVTVDIPGWAQLKNVTIS